MPQLKGSHVFLIVLAESFPQNAVHSVLSTAGLQPSNKRASRYSAQVNVCAPFPLSRLRQGSSSRGPGYEQAGALVPPSPASLTRPAPLLHRQAAGVSHLPTVNLSGAITLPRSGWIRPLYRSLT